MISKEIHQRLNKQINAELRSAYYYLAMSVDARHKNMLGVSNWFYIQAREELDHSRILQNYLFMQNAKIELMPIDAVEGNWKTPESMFEDAYNHERIVTEMIHELAELAQKENDYNTKNILNWFLNEQLEEENSCNDILKQYQDASNDLCVRYQIDKDLKRRNYKRPFVMRGENWIA